MNFFIKHRIIIWILAGFLVVALSALGSLIYHTWIARRTIETIPACTSSCQMLAEKLAFTPSQHNDLEMILDHFSDSSAVLVNNLRQNRMALMDELHKAHPDSMIIARLAGDIGAGQALLIRLAAAQYQQIRGICDSSQQIKLSDFYCDLFGCPHVRKGHEKSPHRHRRGQKK